MISPASEYGRSVQYTLSEVLRPSSRVISSVARTLPGCQEVSASGCTMAVLKNLLEIIEKKDAEGMKAYLTKIREKIK